MTSENGQNQIEQIEERQQCIEATRRKAVEWGKLAFTSQDHLNVGGSPKLILCENPGKTMGELMTDQEILECLDTLKSFTRFKPIENYRNFSAIDNLEYALNQLRLNIKYLRSINRLPAQYEDFVVEQIDQETQ